MICPNCGHDNLAGLDQCEQCLQDLRALDVPLPTEGLQKHIMVGTIGQVEFPFDRLVIVGPTDSVAHTVSRIKGSGIGQALVVEGEKLVGILTERDLLYKLGGPEVELRKIRVKEMMTPNPETVREGDAIRVVMNMMSVGGYRHVPIVRDGKPFRIISAKAIANYILDTSALEFYLPGREEAPISFVTRLRQVKIRHLALRPPVLVELSTTLRDTVEAMKKNHRGCALICDHGNLNGIFTERDLLNKIIGEPVSWSAPVAQFMTPNPAKLSVDDSVVRAMKLMYEGDYRNIPLIDAGGKAAGVVTVRDVIIFFAEHFPKEALNLPPDPYQEMATPEGA